MKPNCPKSTSIHPRRSRETSKNVQTPQLYRRNSHISHHFRHNWSMAIMAHIQMPFIPHTLFICINFYSHWHFHISPALSGYVREYNTLSRCHIFIYIERTLRTPNYCVASIFQSEQIIATHQQVCIHRSTTTAQIASANSLSTGATTNSRSHFNDWFNIDYLRACISNTFDQSKCSVIGILVVLLLLGDYDAYAMYTSNCVRIAATVPH